MLLLVWLALLGGCAAVRLQPAAFLKLPDKFNQYRFNSGTATSAAFDSATQLLYVIGTTGDVLNIISLVSPSNPTIISTRNFNDVTDGFPDALALCRFGLNEFLAISFEKLGTVMKGSVRFFRPLGGPGEPLQEIRDPVSIDGYDPHSIKWNSNCNTLILTAQGRAHTINGGFDNPPGDIELLIPQVAGTVDRTKIPINEDSLREANIRYVMRQCTAGGDLSIQTRIQDLEPSAITVDDDNVAYITLTKNNAIAGIDLNAGTRRIEYVPLSPKAWRGLNIDASNDRQILLRNYPIHSFYQPADIVNFKFNGETYLATADAGFIERLSLVDDDCEFEEAIPGHQWINSQAFGTGLTQEEQNLLRAALSDPSNLGNTLFSKVRASTDGYNPITQGYDRIMAYGGRGMSILKVSTGERIYDSGDLFERVFTGSGFSPAYQAVFNAEVGSFSMPQSERFDTMSTTFGGRPSVIEVGHMQDVNKTVIVVANSYVGGLYYFELDLSGPEPLPVYQGYYRRGNPGISWLEAYNRGEDVGEPDTRDIQWLDTSDGAYIAVLSNLAGAVSFYKLLP